MKPDKDFYQQIGQMSQSINDINIKLDKTIEDHERRINILETCNAKSESAVNFVETIQSKVLSGFIALLFILGVIVVGLYEFFKGK